MASPSIVQSAFLRAGSGSGSNPTITLTSAPAAGNMLVLIGLGSSASGAGTPPPTPLQGAAWTQVSSLNDFGSQAAWVYYRLAVAGENTACLLRNGAYTDWANWMLVEVAGGPGAPIVRAHAGSAPSTATVSIGTLTADVNAGDLRFVGLEFDNTGLTLSGSPPSGWTQVSPPGWVGASNGNHQAGIWSVPLSQSGTASITLSGAPTSGICWADVVIPQGGQTGATRVSQAGTEAWVVGSGVTRVTQVGTEAWAIGAGTARISMFGAEAWTTGQGPVRVSRVGAEVWYSMVPAGVVSRFGSEVWFDQASLPVVVLGGGTVGSMCVIT